jgi:hypothetical protein
MYEFRLENGTEMPLRVQAVVDGDFLSSVIPPTSERYRFVHGGNKMLYICTSNHMLDVMISSLTNPEAPAKKVQLCAHVGNHVTFLCKDPFATGCSPLNLMMTSQLVYPHETTCPGLGP